MNKKSFFLGLLTGVVLTFVTLLIIGLAVQNSNGGNNELNDPIQYLEKPVSYENKQKTSFQVLQVLGNAALAREESEGYDDGDVLYYGNTVLILGENFYSDQIITIENPQRVGTYNYTNNGGMPMTVPVINGNSIE